MDMQSNTPSRTQGSTVEKQRKPFSWRALVSVTTGLSFIVMSVTGLALFVAPPGRFAHWTGWTIVRLSKEQWAGLHIWLSLIFMIAAVLHLYLNWHSFLNYFRDRLRRTFALRKEWAAAVVICVIFCWGTLADIPPFSCLLAWNEAVKRSWETAAQELPVPHAELMTLAELADRIADLEPDVLVERLRAAGIAIASPDSVLGELADDTGMTPRQLYDIATGQNYATPPGHNASRGRGQSGTGRLTLEQFCRQQGMDVDAAVEKLRSQGLRADPGMTFREIASSAGMQPSAVRDMLLR